VYDRQVYAADLLAYPAWRARGLATIKEAEDAAWALCSTIDARLGEGAAKELLAWYDGTARADVLAVLLGEVGRPMMIRMVPRLRVRVNVRVMACPPGAAGSTPGPVPIREFTSPAPASSASHRAKASSP
jgi:hypothetical protein